MSRAVRVVSVLLLVAVTLSGCAVAAYPGGRSEPPRPASTSATPDSGDTATSTPSAGQTPSQRETPSPTPTPTPTPDPTLRVTGANHSRAAAGYVRSSKSVHDWLVHPGVAADYPQTRVAFLTFDDGPSPITEKILDVLAEEHVPASFFLIGTAIGPNTEATVRREIAEGHSVCVHTFSHNYDRLYPGRSGNADAIVADHGRAVQRIRSVLGDDFFAHCYRYPGGYQSWRNLGPSAERLAAQQVYWLDWNALNNDASRRIPKTEAEMVQAVNETWAESDSPNVMVLLMHDAPSKELTASSLRAVIRDLRSKGFTFATLD